MRRLVKGLVSAIAAAVACAGQVQAQAAEPISVELNKLEPTAKGCRVFFVLDNRGDKAIQALKLDLVFFGTDGVIVRRLVVDMAPLRAAKKSVKTFEFDSPPCGQIGSILLNDVAECRGDTGAIPDCLKRVEVSSRAKVQLSK